MDGMAARCDVLWHPPESTPGSLSLNATRDRRFTASERSGIIVELFQIVQFNNVQIGREE